MILFMFSFIEAIEILSCRPIEIMPRYFYISRNMKSSLDVMVIYSLHGNLLKISFYQGSHFRENDSQHHQRRGSIT